MPYASSPHSLERNYCFQDWPSVGVENVAPVIATTLVSGRYSSAPTTSFTWVVAYMKAGLFQHLPGSTAGYALTCTHARTMQGRVCP